ncbi:MAG: T9SS type A sorting domain-containing protein [Saprospiraceae bacterium]|nr:T9SS type A sorting domain-containing protein [Saprospiraceae bacterium]
MNQIQSIVYIVLVTFSCLLSCKPEAIQVPETVNLNPPDDNYLMDKLGEPTLDFMELRKNEIESFKNAKSKYRNPLLNFPGNWTVQGPGNLGGRVNTIAINPKNENIIFIGFSHGGAYRTLDGGKNWSAIFDDQITLYISDIAIDPVNTNNIYIATGDHSGGFYCGQGNGIYKSIDNGNSWKNIGLNETKILTEIILDYTNPKIIYVAALGYSYEKNQHRGLYKSIDAGVSWNKILYLNDSAGITDIVMHPKNPGILFAVGWNKLGFNNRGLVSGPDGQIYKSINGGIHWKKITNGLPSDSLNGRIALAISESHPNILYARYVRTFLCNNRLSNNLFALYKSEDTGESWQELPSLLPGSGLECEDFGGFGWYFDKIAINPLDPDDIYLMAIEIFRSVDGGNNWELAANPWSFYDVHADKHDLVFFKNGDYLLGTDGGLYKHINADDSWVDLEDIPTNQVYRVAYNPSEKSNYYGGLQDNGSTGGNATTIKNWERIYGGDGFQMAFKKDDPTIYYAEYQNGALQQYYHGDWRSFTTGLGGPKNWDFPYMISHHNTSKLLAGSNQVYFNEIDTIDNWKVISPNLVNNPRYASRSNPTITSLDESPLNGSVIIAGTINGNVWLTKNFDQAWVNVSAGLPIAYISSVKTSYKNSNTFYVTLSGLRSNDFNSYVYRTTNNGLNWSSIHSDLPSLPVYDLLVYPFRGDSILFIGNHIGVYGSVDSGESWERIGDNMPFIEVFDLAINEAENTLIAGTFGKSIMSFPLKDILKKIVKVSQAKAELSIQLFPNPATDKLNIQIQEPLKNKILRIQILDYLGRLVQNTILDTTKDSFISIEKYATGLYYLNIYASNQKICKSFTKI